MGLVGHPQVIPGRPYCGACLEGDCKLCEEQFHYEGVTCGCPHTEFWARVREGREDDDG